MFVVFHGFEEIACGTWQDAQRAASATAGAVVLDCETGHRMEASDAGFRPARAGRPRIGVVAREVTLLPAHWEWLATQRGGASKVLRGLITEAMAAPDAQKQILRQAVRRFASALVADAPGYHEAMEALEQGQRDEFSARIEGWPEDVRRHLERMAQSAFA